MCSFFRCYEIVSFMDDCTSSRSPIPFNFSTTHNAQPPPLPQPASSTSLSAIKLTADDGYLALFPNPDNQPPSSASTASGTGVPGCYWRIEAPPGQTIRARWKAVGRAVGDGSGTLRHRRPVAASQAATGGHGRGRGESVSCSVDVMFRDGRTNPTVVSAGCRHQRQETRSGYDDYQELTAAVTEHHDVSLI